MYVKKSPCLSSIKTDAYKRNWFLCSATRVSSSEQAAHLIRPSPHASSAKMSHIHCLSVCWTQVTDERRSTQTCWSHYTRRHLRSANRHLLAVPRFPLNTYGRRAFSVAGPMAWNSLPDFIHDPTSSTDCFRRLLKAYLFARY